PASGARGRVRRCRPQPSGRTGRAVPAAGDRELLGDGVDTGPIGPEDPEPSHDRDHRGLESAARASCPHPRGAAQRLHPRGDRRGDDAPRRLRRHAGRCRRLQLGPRSHPGVLRHGRFRRNRMKDMSHSDSSLKVARRPAPVRSQTADVLRRAIISGRFKTGDRLNERELCELTGVSRTSVREALRILEAEGLVEATPTTGSVVATLTPKQVKDIYEFRAVLEGFGAYQFVRLASHDEIEKGLELIDAVIAAIHDPDTLREEKQRFYEFLFNIAGNNLVAETMERVSA